MKKALKSILCIMLCIIALVSVSSCSLLPSVKPSKDYKNETATELSVGGKTKYYFDALSNLEKHAYNNILSSVFSFPEKIEIPVLDEEGLNRVYTAVLNDNPELFFLDKSCAADTYEEVAFFYPEYSMNLSDYTAMTGKCKTVANEIIKKASECKFDFEKERVVHDEIVAMCSYSNNETNIYKNSIYGVLVYNSASCEGYAKCAKYLLDMLGIESYVITGSSYDSLGEMRSHMWNVVRLGGDWYHLDLTWDDPVTKDGDSVIFYTYFNISDEVISKTHFDFENRNTCTKTENYFFNYERLLFSKFSEKEEEQTAKFAAEIIDKGSRGFQICFESKDAFDKSCEYLFEKEEIYGLLDSISELTDESFATDRVAYVLNEKYNIIEIIIETE